MMDDILKQIKAGEVSGVQFKERILDKYDIACELVAFSNSHGGKLVVGILVVNLTYKNQWGTEGPTVDKVAVGNAAKKATVNYLTKVVSPSAVAEDKADFDMPALTANKQYASIIIPQDGVQKITITIGGKDFIYDNGTPFKFESGKITTINLEVGRDVIKLGDVNISDWGSTGEPIKGEAYD